MLTALAAGAALFLTSLLWIAVREHDGGQTELTVASALVAAGAITPTVAAAMLALAWACQ